MIQEIYNDMGFIIGFMILCLIISMAFGEMPLRYFLLTTLFSVIVLNVNNFTSFLQNSSLNGSD